MAKIPQYTINQLSQLSCEIVAEKLGIEVRRHRALCFMHDDHHPSLSFSVNNCEMWWCYVCNKGGNAIGLVMEYTDFNFIEACNWLGQQFGIHVEKSKMAAATPKVVCKKKRMLTKEVKPFSKEVAQWILENCTLTKEGRKFLFCERLLKPDVVENLNIVSISDSKKLVEGLCKSFDSKTLEESGFLTFTNGKMYFRMFTPCLLFPYYDKQGELVGIQSRYIGVNEDAPRFQFVAAQKTRIFNLPILNTLKFGEDLYISEGITDCLALLSAGKKAVAVPSATIMPKTDLIKLNTFKLHMYPDSDVAGKKAYMNLKHFFVNHYTYLKAECLPEGVKDFSDYYIMKYGTEER